MPHHQSPELSEERPVSKSARLGQPFAVTKDLSLLTTWHVAGREYSAASGQSGRQEAIFPPR